RRQHDAALRGGTGDLGNGKERRAPERGGFIDIRAAAVGQQEGAARAAVLRDAVGISERQQCADRRPTIPTARWLLALPAPRNLRPPPRHAARVARPLGAIAAERIEAMAEIDIAAADPALGENDGDLGGKLGLTRSRRIDHHAREAWRQRQLAQPPPLLGNAAFPIDGAKLAEQSLRPRQRRYRRLI